MIAMLLIFGCGGPYFSSVQLPQKASLSDIEGLSRISSWLQGSAIRMMLWTCGRSSIHYDGVVRREVRVQLHAMDLIRRCIFQEPVSGMLQLAAFLEPHYMYHTQDDTSIVSTCLLQRVC